MRSSKEICFVARHLLIDKQWLWRLLGASILLSLATELLVNFFYSIAAECGCEGIIDNVEKLKAWLTTLDEIPALSGDMIPGLLLIFFLQLLTSGIVLYGNNLMLNRAADDNGQNWLSSAFCGFLMPLELIWLILRMMSVYMLWSFVAALAVTPLLFIAANFTDFNGDVSLNPFTWVCILFVIAVFVTIMMLPFYRYRFLFRIKADHADWSASKCMEYCRKLTEGNRMRSFKLDCSFWRILVVLLLATLGLFASLLVGKTGGDKAFTFGWIVILVSVFWFAMFYIGLSQSILYKEIVAENAKKRDKTENISVGT